jgi:hypothetical protein
MWQSMMSLVRYSAAILILIFAPGMFISQPLLADGGCSEEQSKGCITTNSAYVAKACTSGMGVDCITCDYDPGSVCTWAQGGGDLENYYHDGIG